MKITVTMTVSVDNLSKTVEVCAEGVEYDTDNTLTSGNKQLEFAKGLLQQTFKEMNDKLTHPTSVIDHVTFN